MKRPDPPGILETAPLVARGELKPTALVRESLERIERGRALNAFIAVRADEALEDARRGEREIASGRYRGPLHGIPVSVKDLIDVAGMPTTSGSAVPPLRPEADALLVRRLRDAGAVIIGKTNLHEFAFGTTGDETAFGHIRNPFDTSRSAGGSSSGAAVALVEGMCFASIGTDTGGSIRIPAAACGTVGLKPTHGEVPTEGVVPLSTTCDHAGPLTRTVADAALLFAVLAGVQPAALAPREALRFGIPGGYLLEKLDPEVRETLAAVRRRLEAAGHSIADLAIEHVEMTPDIYLHIVLAEAAEYHAPLLARYPDRYSPGVRLRLEMGGYVLAEDYLRAMRLRAVLTESVDRALEGHDALLLPALAIQAPRLGASTVDIGGTVEPVRAAMLRLTQPFNLTGHPAIAIPAGRSSSGLPIGVQLVGRRHGTGDLLAAARAVETQISGGAGSVGGGTG